MREIELIQWNWPVDQRMQLKKSANNDSLWCFCLAGKINYLYYFERYINMYLS